MALFKSAEEKEALAKQREYEMLQKYGLQNLTNPDDIASVRTIVGELSGTGLMELGALLGGANEKQLLRTQMFFQRALVEQNFIIIRQLDRIASKLDK